MGIMKSKLAMLSLIGLSLAATSDTPFSVREKKSLSGGLPKKPKKVIPKGCKEYNIGIHTVIAMSEKSAIEKARKLDRASGLG